MTSSTPLPLVLAGPVPRAALLRELRRVLIGYLSAPDESPAPRARR